MSHIYIYSPSGAVRDKAAFRRGLARLKALGHEVEVDEAALARHQRFAGDDDARVAAIARAAASGADIALISRGGYGLTRLLPRLPYARIAKAIDKGTQFVGISDFTAFQLAVLARTGALTWAGPGLCADFGAEAEPDEIMLACFEDLACGRGEGTGWRLPKGDVAAQGARMRRALEAGGWMVKGATLWGGNLAVLAGLVGTPWLPTPERGILFLEDVNEHPYRIERMLTQLLHAGILDRQKAVLLGHFSEYRATPHDAGFGLASVVAWLRSQTRTPILTGLPYGHVPTKVLLPVGAAVDLVVQGREALLFWHTHAHDHGHHDHHG
jgi:muramoyltetrapeptide carboxypeptidase